MRLNAMLIGILFFIPLNSCSKVQQDEFPILKGPYLAQKPPDMVPEIFAPGIINTEDKNHSSVTVSPDGEEIYWSLFSTIDGIRQERIWCMRMNREGIWMAPEVAPFSGRYRDGQPSFSPDGRRIYFSSLRAVNQYDRTEDANIWFVEKTRNGWGTPQCIDFTVNTEHQEWFPSVAKNGNIYYALKRVDEGTSWNIYVAKFKAGKYENPKPMGEAINSLFNEMTPYIDPDEKFIIFFSERPTGNFIDGRLYISFRNPDGSWNDAQKLGKYFDTSTTRFPNISLDGKYFFFTKLVNQSEDIYWVNVKSIERINEIKLKQEY